MRKRAKGRRPRRNGAALEYRALGEAYHDACYAAFLDWIEEMLEKNPEARARLDRAFLEFRRAVFENLPPGK